MKDKIIIMSTPEKARRLSQDHIVPDIKTDKFCQGPLGVAYEPAPMKCPCCGSEDTSGPRAARLAAICWDCKALFRVTGGTVEMIDCRCGRHDNGKIIKSAMREEVPSSGDKSEPIN